MNGLANLAGSSVQIWEEDPTIGNGAVRFVFSNGTALRADYWRLIKNQREAFSSFDHKQKYGLPLPIDSPDSLKKELERQTVAEARLDRETGDLIFEFSDHCKLQVLNLSAYEVWEISFPDGSGEFSNYAK